MRRTITTIKRTRKEENKKDKEEEKDADRGRRGRGGQARGGGRGDGPALARVLRAAGGDFCFKFAPDEDETVKALIVGMGVSLVVAAAARVAFEQSHWSSSGL